MSDSEKVFFSILRSALWKTSVEIPEGFTQWGYVYKDAIAQAQIGLVGDLMTTVPEISDSIPKEGLMRVYKLVQSTVRLHLKLNNTLILLVTTLRANGIEPVLLKGQGLARCYPTPELRQSGDIDLYVGVDQYEKTYDILKEIVTEIDDKSTLWNWMHFDAKVGPVMIEVHQRADYMYSRKEDKLYLEYMQDGLSKDLRAVSFGDTDVMTPNDNFNAFYIFYHLWRHFTGSGVGLRQFCDWACFLHTYGNSLDLSYLENVLRTFDLLIPWQVFGCFMVKDLGLPETEFPLYNPKYLGKVSQVRKYVMTDGNFGINLRTSSSGKRSYLSRKYNSLKRHISRIFRMFVIFPRHSLLRMGTVLTNGFEQLSKDMKKSDKPF